MGLNFKMLSKKDFISLSRPIDKAVKKGLLKDIQFIGMNLFEWAEVSKFFLEFDKEISQSSNLRVVILLTTQLIEYILDNIIVRIYTLNKYEKVDPYQFLSLITLRNKIEFLDKLKREYKEKRPLENRYESPIAIRTNSTGYEKLVDKFGEDFFKKIEKYTDELNKENKIKRPKWSYIHNYPPDDDYLDDDSIKILGRINSKKLHLIHDLRNDVSHRLYYKDEVIKRLKVSQSSLESKIKELCRKTVFDIIGVNPAFRK